MAKGNDGLRFAIFEYGEGIAVKIGHNVLLIVYHRGVEQDFVDIFADDEGSSLFTGLLLGRWGRRRCWSV
ncbi:MAG TPA: hypothetical protein VK706_12190 [Candidatus Sulfotelmatobacter sp.]|nr:hypothetical protein [Candidatus Sulfotelmatobacter sp.]